jgi:hypothetical protein
MIGHANNADHRVMLRRNAVQLGYLLVSRSIISDSARSAELP